MCKGNSSTAIKIPKEGPKGYRQETLVGPPVIPERSGRLHIYLEEGGANTSAQGTP